MGNQNSRVTEVLLGLYRETILDLYDAMLPCEVQLPAPRRLEKTRDSEYVEKRIRAEGLSFATIVLPKLGKYVDAKLSNQVCDFPNGLSRNFLRAPLDLLLHIVDLYPETSGVSYWTSEVLTARAEFIRKLRTLLYLTYKLELPSSPELVQLKIDEFVATEKEVSEFLLPDDNRFLEYGRHVLDDIVGGFDPAAKVFPRHGPGAVATGEKGDDKWVFNHFYESLHLKYPYYDFMYGLRSNGRALHLACFCKSYRAMKRLPYPIARLCVVPKDSRGPRIISCEPLELQFMQQAVAPRLMAQLELTTRSEPQECGTTGPSHINFIDQSINAQLALSASQTREWATIDLSEASDRVSQSLFESLWPIGQQGHINALRSHATILLNGEELRLKKFAPMGSALCFPVESAIFYALSVASILSSGCPMDEARRSVFVYGDDIIVKTEYATAVMNCLEMHGLKVNGSKSFIMGHFRESCGIDGWLGQIVTPIRIRKLPGEYPHSGSEHQAWAAYSGHFYAAGMQRAGRYCKEVVETVLGAELPFTEQETGYLSVVHPELVTSLKDYKQVQWSVDLSLPTALVWVLKTRSATSALDGYARLLRNILTADPMRDPNEVVDVKSTKMSRARKGLSTFSVIDWLTMQE